ncbi:energy-coupling factor transporter ATP-binding protein EcfA2 [Arthrobacter bambusae]|uniref:Energy-coupling factor transporter ATP-binding protein EcfA2 n=2 Tax=Arthrobacter bambusae TaxID=1338426 RepID=A0ABV2P6V0_9MICC
MQADEILVNALGSLVRIRFDFSRQQFDEARWGKLRGPWSDAMPENEATPVVENVVAELLWAFPDDDGLPGSVAELSTHTTLAAIEAQRGRLLMLHAAGIAHPSGQVLAFIGPSGRGKTTLARHLGAKYGYVTDETVGIEADGTVHPYRKPLSVIQPGEAYKEQLAPSDLGLGGLPTASLALAGLVLVSRRDGFSGAPRIDTLGLCDALVEIVPEISYLADMDKPLQTIASHVGRCGAIRRVTYSEAFEVLPLVPELLAWEQPEAWEAVLPTVETAGVMSPLAPESYLPAPVLDAVEAGGLTAVLDGNRMVHVLDGVGPLVWRSLCEGRDFASLVHEVERQFGAPPEQQLEEAVVVVLSTLADAGLLVRVPAT